MNHRFTTLNDRILWFDGDSTVRSIDYLYDKLLTGKDVSQCYVREITPEIAFYNKHTKKKLKIKDSVRPLNTEWCIPDEYKNLNVRKFILQKLETEIDNNNFSDNEIELRIQRVGTELELWKSHNLLELLKTLIFIVDELKRNNVVWGTGRGSSCCCYTLYLIGLHDVDSIHYNLDISEFFK